MSNEVNAVSSPTGYAPVALPGAAPATGNVMVSAVAPAMAAQPGQDVLQRAAQQVVAAMPGANKFDFAFDKQSGMTIVKVYNSATGQLVRQIPTEEVVRIAQLLRQEEANPQVVDVIA